MRGTAAAGQVHAKTGLVEHVNSLSGYATSRRGAHLIFAIFSNNTGTHGREAVNAVDAICVAMVEELAPHPAARAADAALRRRRAPPNQARKQISR
jgi:D-alanyl-D-alanine carboxypeptidase/D-alanyl-D-alanine-endopeptidase (penicillin-binding protein 4)